MSAEDYEEIRRRRKAENQKRIEQLNIPNLVNVFMPTPTTSTATKKTNVIFYQVQLISYHLYFTLVITF